MLCVKDVVSKMVCERWCVTKWCVTQRHVRVRNVMRPNKISIYYWHLLAHLDSYARSYSHALGAGRPRSSQLALERTHGHHAGGTLPEILQDLLVLCL